ncbi:MAG: SGNH/GDSL hydrolase family protein [Proteobacteria bacterium]|nr:SGNH/GDSL hydrolase family protein [Pseudomonadota bacterium]MBU0968248.1 SGNH/GDSL hydrolase family protein [Pseudomonadota bacterium]
MRGKAKRLAIFIFVVSTLLAPVLARAQVTFDRIVVFGTSLSDPGNAYALTGWLSKPPYDTLDSLLVPDAAYARGGHHFSNGATWVEQYARSVGLAGSTRPAFLTTDGPAANFAVGGARAREDGINMNLSSQVQAFLGRFPDAPANALYVVEMGSNDIRDALVVDPTGELGVLEEALTAIQIAILDLYDAGARKFLVLNGADISLTPAVRQLDTLMQANGYITGLAWQLSDEFNKKLETQLVYLETTLMDIEIRRLDMSSNLQDYADDPADYGLTEVSEACVTPNVAPFACRNPDEYLFWDGVHPTRAVHAIFAREAASVLAE